jgi:hypothetical protein
VDNLKFDRKKVGTNQEFKTENTYTGNSINVTLLSKVINVKQK